MFRYNCLYIRIRVANLRGKREAWHELHGAGNSDMGARHGISMVTSKHLPMRRPSLTSCTGESPNSPVRHRWA